MSLFCFFSHVFFFPAILLFFTYFAQYFARNFSVLLSISKINCSVSSLQACVTALLEYFVHSDCSIRVSRSLVTISYEHPNTMCDCSIRVPRSFHTKCAKLPFLGAYFSIFPPIFPVFCSLLLPTYFPKKFPAKSARYR